jgi:hypothetical protein
MIKGSCLCGEVQFEMDLVPLIVNCHCSMCRKHHGTPFGTFASVRLQEFRFLGGEDHIQRYESSPGNFRQFCRICGSPVPIVYPDGGTVTVPAGLLDDDPGVRPALHLFVGSKAPWWEITDGLPTFEDWVPGFGPDDA